MDALTVEDDATFRMVIFVSLFLVLAITERLFPKRRNNLWLGRWFSNLSLSALNTLCLRVLSPWSATIFAFIIIKEEVSLFTIYQWHT